MPAPSYTLETDQSILSRLQSRLLETPNLGLSMTTEQFTIAQVIAALDQAQKDFVRDTGIIVWRYGYNGDTNSSLGTVPEVETVQLPQDVIDVRRVAWVSYRAAEAPTGPSSYTVNDPSNNAYTITIADSGVITTTPMGYGIFPILGLNVAGMLTQSFQIQVTDSVPHILTTVPVAFDVTFPTELPIQSPSRGFNLYMFQEFVNTWVLAAQLQAFSVAEPDNIVELPAQDSSAADATDTTWESDRDAIPYAEEETLAALPAILLQRPPSDVGQVDLTYVPVPNALSNTGTPVSIPPDFVPAIQWRALWILLNANTEANDVIRAQYCEQMYQLWVGLALSAVAVQGHLAMQAQQRQVNQ